MQAIEQKRIRKLEREQKKEEKRKKIEETHIQREQKSKEDHHCVIICKKTGAATRGKGGNTRGTSNTENGMIILITIII